jgi:signal transduction histidine kinase
LADAHARPDFAIEIDLPAVMPELAMEQVALEAVLATLIENARQAGADELKVNAQLMVGTATIALSDNGSGVPEADRSRIFDPFFTSKRASGGTGLGLPIARALAESCGGALELSETETGACFVLTLPVAPA